MQQTWFCNSRSLQPIGTGEEKPETRFVQLRGEGQVALTLDAKTVRASSSCCVGAFTSGLMTGIPATSHRETAARHQHKCRCADHSSLNGVVQKSLNLDGLVER